MLFCQPAMRKFLGYKISYTNFASLLLMLFSQSLGKLKAKTEQKGENQCWKNSLWSRLHPHWPESSPEAFFPAPFRIFARAFACMIGMKP